MQIAPLNFPSRKVQVKKKSINCNNFSKGSTVVYFDMVFSLDADSESIVPEVQAEKEWSLGTQAAKTVNEEIAKGNPVIFRWTAEKKILSGLASAFIQESVMKLVERGTIQMVTGRFHFKKFSFTYFFTGSSSPLYDGQMLFHLHLSDGTPIPGIADNDEPIVSLRKTHVTNINTLPDQSRSPEEYTLPFTNDQPHNSPLVQFVSPTFNEIYYASTEVHPSTSPSHLEDLGSSDNHPSTQSYGVGRLSSDVNEPNSLPEIEIRLSSEIYPSR